MESILRKNKDIKVVMEYNVGGPKGISGQEFLKYIHLLGFDIYELYADKPLRKVTDRYLLTQYGPKAKHHAEIVLKRT